MHRYLDSSACVKLFVRESESGILTAMLKAAAYQQPSKIFVSELTVLETNRALARRGIAQSVARDLFLSCEIVPMTERVLAQAASVRPLQLRTLDAIHLASGLMLQQALDIDFVTYDRQLGAAARDAGLKVLTPGY